MTQPIHDPDVRQLAAIAEAIKNDYLKDYDQWIGSPFQWLKSPMPIRRSGTAFEDLISRWCAEKGLSVEEAEGTDADKVIAGVRTEIKGATLSEAGSYIFNQIRNQDYSILLCLGVTPSDAHCWAIPKLDVMDFRKDGRIPNQHANAPATGILTVPVDNVPDWLQPYGGTLGEGFARLQSLTRQT